MAYIDGQLLVAGMSNEEFSSNLRRIAFPFADGMVDNSLEIFHVSHGKWETAAPIRTFEILEIPDGRKIRILRRPARQATVTDMAYIDGQLLVAGMSNEEFSSNLRRIAFPFADGMVDNSLEIFHVSHGKWETAAPIRTF